jgi:maltose-binding protein MalE
MTIADQPRRSAKHRPDDDRLGAQSADYRQVWGDNVGVRPLPRLSQTGNDSQPYVRSSVLALNPRSSEAQQNAAFNLLRFLTGSLAQTELRSIGLPTARRDLSDADPVQAQIELAASRGVAWPTSIRFNRSWDTLAAMLRNVLNGAPIDTTISETDRAFAKSITCFSLGLAPPSLLRELNMPLRWDL